MTVANTGSRDQYTATASQTVFPYTFKVFSADDITVKADGVVVTGYTVSGVENDNGGNITFSSGRTAGEIITIYRDMDLERLVDYQPSGDFLAEDVNDDFDRLWLAIQQLTTSSSLSIRAPLDDSVLTSSNTELANVATRGGKALGFNPDGTIAYLSMAVPTGTYYYVSTVAAAQALTGLTAGTDVVEIAERANAKFDVIAATTNNGYDVLDGTASGVSLRLRVVSKMPLRAFGTVGDDVSDDNGAIQAAFDSKARVLLGHPDDIYRSDSELDMAENQTLDLCGAELKFYESGFVRYLVTNNDCTVQNGTVRSATSDVTVRGGDYQQPIVIGQQNSLTGVDNVIVRNVRFSTTSPEGNAVFVFSACNNILVENIIIESGSSFGEPIGAHWGVGNGGDETQGTSHPNNIVFRNVYIEEQSYGGAGPIFLSAVRNVLLEDIVIEDYTGDGCIQIFAGDHGFTYALKPEDKEFGSVITMNNITGRGAKGVLVFMRDTLDSQVKWPSRIKISNSHFTCTTPATGTTRGIELGSVNDVYVENTTFEDFFYNVFFNGTAEGVKFNQCRFLNSTDNCIDANNSNGCRDLKFINCHFEGSNQNGGTGYDALFGSYIDGITFDGCFFDSPDTTFTMFFDNAEPPRNVKIINNHVENAGGSNFVFGASTSFGICELFSGNTQGEQNNNNIRGGQDLVPFSYAAQQNSKLPTKLYYGGATPSYGTYNAGDIIYDETPSASGKIGWVCTVSGTEGTYSEGLTATTDGTTSVALSAASNVLRKGDYVTINSTNVRVESISGTSVTVSATIASGSGLAIAYTAGTYKAWGAIDA